MKIVAIRGKNLASLEGEFEIDFTKEPLLSAGIFAITGSTGSGKSTLLDALCLALFDDTPRTNRAGENISVPDVRDKSINQRDSRTILRRGTGDGYAEVDFISLGGDMYRSTWMVKRARGKADGSLQACEMRLMNLSEQTEIPGRRTELLAHIVQLIGLTFEQFTRAVLLAQGDFATFLKARQSEKAELLEKLTGTDIYSRISVSIYERTKEAEQSLQMLQDRIKDIELLTEEQVASFTEEKNTLMNELIALKNSYTIITEKMKWIVQDEGLKKGLEEAESNLLISQKSIEDAQNRYDYILRIESVQEIRDTFNEWQQTNRQITLFETNVTDHIQKQKNNFRELEIANQQCSLLENKQKALEDEMSGIEPEIIKARALDVEMKSAEENYNHAGKEFKEAETSHKKTKESIGIIREKLNSCRKVIDKLSEWFSQNREYQEIAPRTDLLINLLNDASTANYQLNNNRQLIFQNKEILLNETDQLNKLQKEAERLDKLLPAEIAVLRNKLQPGMPCPVCGSMDHPLKGENENSRLQEEELNRAKRENEKQVAILINTIEERKNAVTRLEILIESYQKQSYDCLAKAKTYLKPLPDWEKLFEQDCLQKQLRKKTEIWNQNQTALSANQNEKISLEKQLEYEEKRASEEFKLKNIKEKRLQETEKAFKQLSAERQKILGGRQADDVARYYADRKTQLVTETQKANSCQKDLIAKNESFNGTISQINNEIARLKETSLVLKQQIDQWINQMKNITFEQLTELLSKDNNWLTAERKYLNSLKEKETADRATLAERRNNYAIHQNAHILPENEDETYPFLESQRENLTMLIEQKQTRNTEIDLAFSKHQQGKERIKTFEKELSEKQEVTNNWKKLNEMFGSATGSKFKEIAQGYTLDALLTYANKQLEELSDRYRLERIPNTLALQVIDRDMLNEVRTVHSLSGGESFLVSLALALGLSSLSSNRMKIESLFIDEGFGSLDMETLRIAMDALERLQNQGRKIGVISHVVEMTERIPAQVKILKSSNGRSYVEIMANS